ncbi:acetyl-CoA carboxylase beta subunit [Arthrobacter pascens]|nr:acetyl-CoA carboxylase beta subunit [Arthrobacter pascens]
MNAVKRATREGRAHRQAGLPYLVYVRHPTTGGVMASWGSLGHITVAEPGEPCSDSWGPRL